ncbi:MAG: hypothetical protein COV76_06045 [Candidatus Omnitrophica bacterium CG11_big_fil_rev_8_21_14_0_20_64_10]|nr:MAG: hypothetical protein COV76_06045 [Candidatus Omnitrophica bacterium CG11_big_fil_rev_8_21_14_0_20_64_10]
MGILLLVIGSLFLGSGIGYLFHPLRVMRLNEWMRENVFTDEWITLVPRRAGIALVLWGFLMLLGAIHFLSQGASRDEKSLTLLKSPPMQKHAPRKISKRS